MSSILQLSQGYSSMESAREHKPAVDRGTHGAQAVGMQSSKTGEATASLLAPEWGSKIFLLLTRLYCHIVNSVSNDEIKQYSIIYLDLFIKQPILPYVYIKPPMYLLTLANCIKHYVSTNEIFSNFLYLPRQPAMPNKQPIWQYICKNLTMYLHFCREFKLTYNKTRCVNLSLGEQTTRGIGLDLLCAPAATASVQHQGNLHNFRTIKHLSCRYKRGRTQLPDRPCSASQHRLTRDCGKETMLKPTYRYTGVISLLFKQKCRLVHITEGISPWLPISAKALKTYGRG